MCKFFISIKSIYTWILVINGTAFEVNHRKFSYLIDENFEFDDETPFDRYDGKDTYDVSIISIKGTENSIKGAPWGAENATII